MSDRHTFPGTLAEQWRAVIARVDLSRGPFPVEFYIDDEPTSLRARVRVPSSENPDVLTVDNHELRLTFSLNDTDFQPCVANLYRAARWLYVHELTEWFKVDGAAFIRSHYISDGVTIHQRIDAPDGCLIEPIPVNGRP